MVSFRITDTYQAYKSRERTFTVWLKNTGEKLGLKFPKPKNKAEKIEAAKHDVTISEVQKLVNLCIERGETLPESVRCDLRDVVRQRKEAAGFYRAKGEKKADEGHAFYLQVLIWALERFEEMKGTAVMNEPESKVVTSNKKDEIAKLGNAFESLDIEVTTSADADADVDADADADAGDGSAPNGESDKKHLPKKKSKSQSKIVFKKKGKAQKPKKAAKKADPTTENDYLDLLVATREAEAIEDDYYEEECFMIYCFFKDWNNLREYLQERWCDYQDGLLSLATVSVITNTAFDLLQKSEEELLAMLPPDSEFRDFGAMVGLLFFEGYLIHVDDNAQKNMVAHEDNHYEALSAEADWICMFRYWALDEWLQNAPPRGVPAAQQMFPEPIHYHGSSGKEKTQRDRQILYEMIAECSMLKALHLDPDFQVPAEDEFSRGIMRMLKTRTIPIWLVFASQTICDIRYILEDDVSLCHDELLYQGSRVRGILTKYIDFADNFDIPVNRLIKRTTLGEVDCWVNEDFMEPRRTELHVKHGVPKSEVEPFYYLRRNPVLCGLMSFRFSLTMNEIGLKNSNQWGATIASAHLYNALRHERTSLPQWADMEALIFIHSNQRIFWRDQLPSDATQYAQSYERATGVGEMIEQRNSKSSRGGPIMPKKIHQRGIGPVSILSMQFHERFCFAHSTKIDSLPDIERVLNDVSQREIEYSLAGLRLLEDASLSPHTATSNSLDTADEAMTIFRPAAEHLSSRALTTQFQATGTLTNIELLEALCTRLTQEANALNFDYFSFHITCMRMLKAVYEEFEKEIIAADTALDWGRAEMPVVPHWLFRWMEEDEVKKENITERLQKVMEPMIKDEGTTELRALQKFFRKTGASQTRSHEPARIEA